MKRVFVTSRLNAKARTIVPKTVREALHLGPGDRIGYTIQGGGRVLLTAVTKPMSREDPFACFEE